MHFVRHITTAVFVFIHAHAVQLKANSSMTSWPPWLRVVHPNGGMTCYVEDECIEGHGEGSCFVSVDAFSVPAPLSSTDIGRDVNFINTLDGSVQPLTGHFTYPPESLETAVYSFVIMGQSTESHWNLCWDEQIAGNQRDSREGCCAENYCYEVNGLCFLWASPCSGASWCSQLNPLSAYDWFCPGGLRYATQSEFDAATPTLYADKLAFHSKCAARQLDPRHNHCDFGNSFVRVENFGFDELILICDGHSTPLPTPKPTPSPTPSPTPTFPTPSPTPSPTYPLGWPTPHPTFGVESASGMGGVAATGDPHLQNVYGERFDLMRPGKHILIHIPRGQPAEKTVLRVEADAVQLGAQCTDMYFQELNITGAWVEAKMTGGFHFNARGKGGGETPKWERFGKVEVKVAHGRTQEGTQYLNFYVKNLARAGFAVGGLLGEDDHTQAVTPSGACVRRSLSLLQISR